MAFSILLVVELLVLLFAASFLISLFSGAPFVRTTKKNLEEIRKIYKPKLNERIIDLGSGSGFIILDFVKDGFETHGVEVNPFLFFISNLNLIFKGKYGKSKIFLNKIENVNFSKYDLFIAYLMPGLMKQIESKFKKEAKVGAKLITNTFKMGDLKPVAQINKIMLYEKK